MKVAYREEISKIDHLASKDYRIPSIILMENAGEAVFNHIRNTFPNYQKLKYNIFCGIGNNGGDGSVVARKLFLSGASVRVYFLGDPKKSVGNAKKNFDIIGALSIPYDKIENVQSWNKMRFLVQNSDVFIDAIFGIGFHGDAREPFISVCSTLNDIKNLYPDKKIISVDIPSGLYADYGISGYTIQADLTVTFGLPKPGLLDNPGRSFTGKLVVEPINLPPSLLQNHKLTLNHLTLSEAAALVPQRQDNGHKGTFGHLLVIGGQHGMIGAPLFCATAALRAGVGLVTLVLPEELVNTAQSKEPAIMVRGYPDSDEAVQTILSFITQHNIQHIVIGNGLGTQSIAKIILSHILDLKHLKSLVLDADALNLLAQEKNLQEKLQACNFPTLLTPHVGEMSRLTNTTVKEIKSLKIDSTETLSTKLQTNVLLKDSVSAARFTSGQKWILNRGNSALSKGGSGDILSGLIGGLLSSGQKMETAVLLGTFLLGLSAELYSQNYNEFSMLPDDLLKTIPQAWKTLIEERSTL